MCTAGEVAFGLCPVSACALASTKGSNIQIQIVKSAVGICVPSHQVASFLVKYSFMRNPRHQAWAYWAPGLHPHSSVLLLAFLSKNGTSFARIGNGRVE